MDLKNKVVIITGGTGAIGKETVLALLKYNAKVIFTYYRNIENKDALERLGAKGYFLDLTSQASLEKFCSIIAQEVNCFDVLINNAAVIIDATIVKLNEEDWDRVFFADYAAPLIIIKRLKTFIRRNGKILNIASSVGIYGAYGQVNYATAKGALLGATKDLAGELAENDIIINALNPGFTPSAMTRQAPEKVKENNLRKSCFGKYFDSRILANFICFYVSDRFKGVSGQIFTMDDRLRP